MPVEHGIKAILLLAVALYRAAAGLEIPGQKAQRHAAPVQARPAHAFAGLERAGLAAGFQHNAEANVKETIKACEHYHSLGCRAVAIVSPFYFKLTPAGVYAYFKEIAQNSPVDVTLYNIPMFATPIDLPTIRKLAELPRNSSPTRIRNRCELTGRPRGTYPCPR